MPLSKIKINSLEDSGNNAVYGAKAWVNFRGNGTVTIRESRNISSITDNGVGDYILIFTNALATANYAVAFSAGYGRASLSGGMYARQCETGFGISSSANCRVFSGEQYTSFGATDVEFINVVIMA